MNGAPTLTERLKTVFDMAPAAASAADIGCDHAQLAINLYVRGKAERVYASDIRPGPLSSARENIRRFGCEGAIETVLAPGLDGVIDAGVEVYIIAGMGGETVAAILDAHKARFTGRETFVLQPQSSVEDLRRYLYENGFLIEDERLAAEGERIYCAMRARFTGERRECEEVYYYIGKRLAENGDPLLLRLIEKRMREHEKIRAGLICSGQRERAAEIERLTDAMKRLKKEIKK